MATAAQVQDSCIFQVTVLRKGMLEKKMGVNFARRVAREMLNARMLDLNWVGLEKRERAVKGFEGGGRRIEEWAGRGVVERRWVVWDSVRAGGVGLVSWLMIGGGCVLGILVDGRWEDCACLRSESSKAH